MAIITNCYEQHGPLDACVWQPITVTGHTAAGQTMKNMKKKLHARFQSHGTLACVQPTTQILFHAAVRSGFRRCGGTGALLVLLCLFFSAARVLAQTDALGTATLLEGPAAGPTAWCWRSRPRRKPGQPRRMRPD